MSYNDDRLNQLDGQIQQLTNLKRQLRQREKSIMAREQYISNPSAFQFNSVQQLKRNLGQALPPNMMPGNVGGINEVTWPFYFQIEVDLGDDPTISDQIFTRSFFQVDQEAALLVTSIAWTPNTNSVGFSACANAPLQVDFIDRQSTRRFSSQPIPLQSIGCNSLPSILPVPYYLMPNAFLDVQVSGINEEEQDFTGSGEFQISIFGYRIRTEDAGKILSTIFGQV